MMKIWFGLLMMMVLTTGVPAILAQETSPNRTFYLDNIKNGNMNDDMMGLMITCHSFLKDYENGQINLSQVIQDCDHQALYYYGVCEEVAGPNLNKGNVTSDCYGSEYYILLRNLSFEPRPHNWIP